MANESLLKYGVKESIGQVNAVDTGTATVVVTDDSVLSQLQINQLLAIKSPRPGRHIIAMIMKIFRKSASIDTTEEDEESEALEQMSLNVIKIVFIGEFIDHEGIKFNLFRRNVSAVPSIDASCYKIEGDRLFYKLPGTEDKWKSVSFEMVSEDIFIFNNSSVFIRKK